VCGDVLLVGLQFISEAEHVQFFDCGLAKSGRRCTSTIVSESSAPLAAADVVRNCAASSEERRKTLAGLCRIAWKAPQLLTVWYVESLLINVILRIPAAAH